MGLSEHGKKATSPGRSILFLPKKDKQRLHIGSNFCHGWTAPHVSARPLEYGEFAKRRGGGEVESFPNFFHLFFASFFLGEF
jgi:hypothetical protein